MERKAEQNLQASLNQDVFKETDLCTLTIPLHLPYINDSPTFERVDGEITKDGRIYHFVKRAVRNGSLVLLCLPDQRKMQIERAKDDFIKHAADDEGSNTSKKNSDGKEDLVKSFRAKYLQIVADANNQRICTNTKQLFGFYTTALRERVRCLPEQPPELS